MSGHCDHCSDECKKKPRTVHRTGWAEGRLVCAASWLDGYCPACAERARIADWVEDAPDWLSRWELAQSIRHGEHMMQPEPEPEPERERCGKVIGVLHENMHGPGGPVATPIVCNLDPGHEGDC